MYRKTRCRVRLNKENHTQIGHKYILLICDNSVTIQKFVIFQERHLKFFKCCNSLWVQGRHNCSPAASFCKLRYVTIPVKSASANVSFYTNDSKIAKFWIVKLLSQMKDMCSPPPPFTIGLSKGAVMVAVACVCGIIKLSLRKLS